MNTKRYTMLGYGAILIWGMGAAFTRTLSEGLGAFTSTALTNIIAGTASLIYQIIAGKGLKNFKKAPLGYWIWCGLLYISFVLTSYFSVTMAENREQVMIIVLIKLLWPLMTLVFTIPILKAKATPWLWGSVVISIVGIVIANLGGNVQDVSSFMANLSSNLLPYLLALASSFAWGLYSNLTSKYIGDSDCDGVGFFMLSIGLVLGAVSLTMNEPRLFDGSMVGQLAYQSIITIFTATLLWNASMRKGNVVAVAVASNLSPLITTVSTALLLGVAITVPVIIGTVLVIAGTVWSKMCFVSEKTVAAN